jgi:hypothetical protein
MLTVSQSIIGAIGLISALFVAIQSLAQSVAYGSVVGEPVPAVERNMSDPFDARVALGKTAEERAEFKAYVSAFNRRVGDHFAQTMRSCFATTQKPETDAFVLVADITVEGKAKAIEVRPATNIALCFATGFASAPFPRPPLYPDREAYPVTIEMSISK